MELGTELEQKPNQLTDCFYENQHYRYYSLYSS